MSLDFAIIIHMEFEWTEDKTKNAVVGVVWFVLLVVLFVAFFVGRDLARSNFAFKQVGQIISGLDYFYQDNDRFPSEVEFSEVNLMQKYYANLPYYSVVSKKCPSPIEYTSFDRLTFQIDFCIPRNYFGWMAGQHRVDQFDSLPGS